MKIKRSDKDFWDILTSSIFIFNISSPWDERRTFVSNASSLFVNSPFAMEMPWFYCDVHLWFYGRGNDRETSELKIRSFLHFNAMFFIVFHLCNDITTHRERCKQINRKRECKMQMTSTHHEIYFLFRTIILSPPYFSSSPCIFLFYTSEGIDW